MTANAYDSAGNLANHPTTGTISYDGLNRLVRFENGSTKFSRGYDAEGRRLVVRQSLLVLVAL